GDYREVQLKALKEVGPAVFFSLLVIAVSFLPIFTLVDQEGRLFKPLAYSKNLVMAIASVLAVTLNAALIMIFIRMKPIRWGPPWLSTLLNHVAVGKYYPEEKHPCTPLLFTLFTPVSRNSLR